MSKVVQLKPREKHTNKLPFEGVLTLIDTPSDKAPNGSRGHRVMLPREAAEEALPSLVGMAVDFKPGWEEHDNKQKIGIIENAWIDGKEIHVNGYLFGRDFAHIVSEMRRPSRPLGMSYELYDAHIECMDDPIWRLSKFEFSGAAILYCDKAAYKATRFNIAASAIREPLRNGEIALSFIDSNETTGSIKPEGRA